MNQQEKQYHEAEMQRAKESFARHKTLDAWEADVKQWKERAEKAEAKVVELRNAEVATFQYINHVLKSLPPEERPAVQRIIDGIKKAKHQGEQQ